MSGDAGNDTYYVDSSEDLAVELAGEGTDTVHTTVSFALGQHVENLIADSDAGLTLTGNGLANIMRLGPPYKLQAARRCAHKHVQDKWSERAVHHQCVLATTHGDMS